MKDCMAADRRAKRAMEMTEEGLSSTEIAVVLDCSRRTVHRYRAKIRKRQEEKHGVQGR